MAGEDHELTLAGAIYAFWILFTTDDLFRAVRWGVVAVVLVQVIAFLRGFMATHLEANRVLRAVGRVELSQVRREGER